MRESQPLSHKKKGKNKGSSGGRRSRSRSRSPQRHTNVLSVVPIDIIIPFLREDESGHYEVDPGANPERVAELFRRDAALNGVHNIFLLSGLLQRMMSIDDVTIDILLEVANDNMKIISLPSQPTSHQLEVNSKLFLRRINYKTCYFYFC